MSKKPPIRFDVRVSTLPPEGDTVEMSARENERAALAEFLDLVEVSRFDAEVALKPAGSGAVVVRGKIEAALVQNCVVTLEPIEQTVSETFTLRLVPEGSNEAAASRARVDVDPDAEDPPDAYRGDHINIGAIAVEHLALAVDAYPRAPGAALPDEGVGGDPAAVGGPFAELARLKEPPGGGE